VIKEMQRSKSSVYHCQRVRGQPRRIYVGTLADPVTRILIDADDLARATREASATATAVELDMYASVEPALRLLTAEANRLVRQDRYQRRRQREQAEANRHQQGGVAMRPTSNGRDGEADLSRDDFDELVENAASGDEAAVDELRRVLRGNPAIYRVLGDLGRHVQMSLIDAAAPNSVEIRESLKLTMDNLRRELLDDGESALEQLLVELVIASLLDVAILRIGFSQPHPKETHKRRWERRLDGALKRHLAAVAALAELRSQQEPA
jgi:hypothetical protein